MCLALTDSPTPGPYPLSLHDALPIYDPPVAFNEITHRANALGTVHDDMTYDLVTGRLTSWDTTGPPAGPPGDVHRDFQYDGAGRLRRVDRNTAANSRTTRLSYDVDDEIVLETATSGAAASIYRFSGWRKELPSGRVIEPVLPMVRLDGGVARIAYLEPDGHAMWTKGTGALAD